jgi:hypothetical protein
MSLFLSLGRKCKENSITMKIIFFIHLFSCLEQEKHTLNINNNIVDPFIALRPSEIERRNKNLIKLFSSPLSPPLSM